MEPDLGEEQRRAYEIIVEERKNVFVTGGAGTGKSYLLNHVIRAFNPEKIAVTASTGIAAVHIGGTTLHSFAGIGLGTEPLDKLIVRASRRAQKMRWLATEVLVIDEISMIDGELFDKIECIARKVRNCDRPFGGIQLVLCGDFFQLPPVAKDGLKHFAFESRAWAECVDVMIELRTPFRQTDPAFVGMLAELRIGFCAPSTSGALAQLAATQFPEDGIEPTRLYPLNRDVASENNARLRELETEPVVFQSQDTGEPRYVEMLEKNCLARTSIELKVGAQVMLLKNLDAARRLVNGARGMVIRFASAREDLERQRNQLLAMAQQQKGGDSDEVRAQIDRALMRMRTAPDDDIQPVVKFAGGEVVRLSRQSWEIEVNGKIVAVRRQVPLALAWSLSIHKCQGMSLDRVQLSLGNVFEYGQAYVALSRATTMTGLRVMDFDAKTIQAHPIALHFYADSALIEKSSALETVLERCGPAPKRTPAFHSSTPSLSPPSAPAFHPVPSPPSRPDAPPQGAPQGFVPARSLLSKLHPHRAAAGASAQQVAPPPRPPPPSGTHAGWQQKAEAMAWHRPAHAPIRVPAGLLQPTGLASACAGAAPMGAGAGLPRRRDRERAKPAARKTRVRTASGANGASIGSLGGNTLLNFFAQKAPPRTPPARARDTAEESSPDSEIEILDDGNDERYFCPPTKSPVYHRAVSRFPQLEQSPRNGGESGDLPGSPILSSASAAVSPSKSPRSESTQDAHQVARERVYVKLWKLRKKIAFSRNEVSTSILSNTALLHISRSLPLTKDAFLAAVHPEFDDSKWDQYGSLFVAALKGAKEGDPDLAPTS